MGVDGTGKSSLLRGIDKWLNQSGYSTSSLKLPRYDSSVQPVRFLGGLLDKIVLIGDAKADKRLISLAFGGSVAMYRLARRLAVIGEPDFLLLERHPVLDSLAYSSVYGNKYLAGLSKLLAGSRVPDLIIYLRADELTSLERILSRFRIEKDYRKRGTHFHERLGYLKRLDKAYLSVLESFCSDYLVIDTSNASKDEVLSMAVDGLNHKLLV